MLKSNAAMESKVVSCKKRKGNPYDDEDLTEDGPA